MLKQIHIKGYKRLLDVSVDFTDRPFAVLIGANGSGKTAFLEVFELQAAIAQGDLRDTISDKGGFEQILTRGIAKELTLSVSHKLDIYNKFQQESIPTLLQYDVALSRQSIGYNIVRETVTQPESPSGAVLIHLKREDGRLLQGAMQSPLLGSGQSEWIMNASESALSQLSSIVPEAASFRDILRSCAKYGLIDTSSRSPVRVPQRLEPATSPGANGEYLLSVLYSMRETDPDLFESLEDTLKVVFPDFCGLTFPVVAGGMVTMVWKDKNFEKPFYQNELSEGTLRFLWLLTILQGRTLPDEKGRSLPNVLLIDEPEVSLHPEMMPLLIHEMRDASRYCQVIVTTHSDRFLQYLEPKEVLICDICEECAEAGTAKLTWADQMEDTDVKRWLEDYTLSELWAMNVLGGRP